MKILYLSCHSILEYDEIKLFVELGHQVFSMGTYHNPGKIDDPKRPVLDIPYYPDLDKLATPDDKKNIPQKLIDWADVIIVMHIADWIAANWPKFKGKRVIWRSIGQSTLEVETLLRPFRRQGIEIVRYSPLERTIPGYNGQDAEIRFFKDPDEFKGWTGEKKEVITVGQDIQQRWASSNWNVIDKVFKTLPAHVFGPHNEGTGHYNAGCPDYEGLKDVLRKNRVFFYTGTQPASYTLGLIEAMMTGTPIVALGPELGNSPEFAYQRTYELPNIIKNGINGFISDDIDTLIKYCRDLLDDDKLAAKISAAGRKTAIEYFGKTKIKDQWKKYLK